jgi:hypothetical protein
MESTVTSISSASLASSFVSPRERLQTELESRVSAGSIQSTDLEALTGALDDIDATMMQQRSSFAGSRPSPTEMTDKINSLIDSQVESGKLTSDQAEELKSVFANALPSPGGPGGAGGPGRPGGGDQASATDGSSDSSDITDLLEQLVSAIQESRSKNAGYGASGETSFSIQSLVVNFQT